MLRIKQFVIVTLPAVFVAGDAISTYFALAGGKGKEVNLIMAQYEPIVIFSLNMMFALTLLVLCIYLDRKLHKNKTYPTGFVTTIKNIRRLSEIDKLALTYATLLTIAVIRSMAVFNNLLVLDGVQGLIPWFSSVFNTTNYQSMLMIYGLLFSVIFPLAVSFVNKMYSDNVKNQVMPT